MQSKKTKLFLSATVAGIIGAGTFLAHSTPGFAEDTTTAKADSVHCYGVNACHGKSACKTTGMNECKGKNACKGKGVMLMTADECKTQGGSTEAPKTTATPATK